MLAARNSPPTQGVKCAPEGGSSRGAHQLPKPKILRPPPILTPQAPEMPCRWSCRQCRPRRRGLVTLCSVHRSVASTPSLFLPPAASGSLPHPILSPSPTKPVRLHR